jgi:threonine/homoserine/homoserine lactone efflux protein
MFSTFFLPAVSFGLSAASVPGPLQAYLLSATLRLGWRRSIYAVLSPLLSDPPLIVLIVFVLGQLPDAAIQVIRVCGALLLLRIAWGAWGQYRIGATFGPQTGPQGDDTTPLTVRRVLLDSMLINVLSPGPYLFWSTITGPLLLDALGQSLLHALVFLVGFYGTFMGGNALLVLTFDRLGRVNPRVTRGLLLLTVLLLVWFASALLADALDLRVQHQALSLLVMPLLVVLAVWDFLRRTRRRIAPQANADGENR